ncbi:hypothetical protein HMPREF9056_02739 [Actinomyces sp. oral taxon 170 str. F0386]|nr:hypothetical protein HMPREF9056_02739 [Actinomyces sp. oral taxon 170 str. F0386]
MSRIVGVTMAAVRRKSKYLFAMLTHADARTPGNVPKGTRNQREGPIPVCRIM